MPLSHRGHRCVGRGAGGLRGVLYGHARRYQERDSFCRGAASGVGPQEHSLGAHQTLHPDAGPRGRGRDAAPSKLRLYHPAQLEHGDFERHATAHKAEPAGPPTPAHRLFLPLPGPRPGRARHLHHPVRYRERRDAGHQSRQGREGHDHGPGSRLRRLRRNASQRYCHGPRGLRARTGVHARPAHSLRRSRLFEVGDAVRKADSQRR